MEETKEFFMSYATEIIGLQLITSGSFKDKFLSIHWKLTPDR
jgi:hypothetical protein